MLTGLHVKNMALIREADIELEPGLNILTGETGAGKSIMIGSVNTALGFGHFRDYIPEGADSALVELIFDDREGASRALMESFDLPWEDGQIVISRVFRSGRTISRVNGETVSMNTVRKLAAVLIDIHGQHQHQSLLHGDSHRVLLDRYAKAELGTLPAQCQEAYRRYAAAKTKLEQAVMDEGERAKQIDLLSYEVREITEASLQSGEDEALESRFARMRAGSQIREALGIARDCFDRDEGISDLIGRAVREVTGVTRYDDSLQELCDSLCQAEDLCRDISRTAGDLLDSFDFDEEQMEETARRLDLINHLKQKYGKSIEAVLAYLDDAQGRLDQLSDYGRYLDGLRKEEKACREKLEAIAAKITRIRQEAAGPLGTALERALCDLNFEGARLQVEVSAREQIGESGADNVTFMISTNEGSPLRPVWEVASGGELSRIMLAIKSVMAGQDHIGTLIFDEIDTGISGRTAQKVAEKMSVIAKHHQVICITHLAQIAAMADRHYEIAKTSEGGGVRTHIRRLDREESLEELARILGGISITEAVRENAREMKDLADSFKQNL